VGSNTYSGRNGLTTANPKCYGGNMQYAVRLVLVASVVLGCSSASDDMSSASPETDVARSVDTDEVTPQEPAICGDGLCETGEQCDADCVVDCWTKQCGLQQAACLATMECSALKTCVWGCPTQACVTRCQERFTVEINRTFTAFYDCGVASGCDVMVCGDGRCQPGEDCEQDCAAAESCYGRCDFTFDNGKPCQCDAKCRDNNDCCVDHSELCVATSTICGDGQCDAPDETVATCAFDCGTAIDQCLAGPCKNAFVGCYSTPGCPNLRGCFDSCGDDSACTLSCLNNASQSASDALQILLSCGEQAGCFDT